MKRSLSSKFGTSSSALQGFVDEMEKQAQWENVVLMTESEFARTLDSNGGGSDHAYAGNHFIVGGALHLGLDSLQSGIPRPWHLAVHATSG